MSTIAIMYALFSAISMGGVYVLDAFMAGKEVYSRASQVMFMSSIFSLLPAPLIILVFGNDCILPLNICFIAVLGGSLLALANWVYFSALYSDEGEAIEQSTELSVYECSTPALILIFTFIMSVLGFQYQEEISSMQILGVSVVVFALILFATYGNKFKGEFRWKYRILLIMFPLLSGSYQFMEDKALLLASQAKPELSQTEVFLVTSIYFWIGLSLGIIVLLPKKERQHFKEHVGVMKENLKLIVGAEIIALLSFAALLGSLNETNVVATAAISGSFPIFVFLGGLFLIKKGFPAGESLANENHIRVKFLAITIVIAGLILIAL